MNELTIYGEHDPRNKFELDDEPVQSIIDADGEPVSITVLMTTPKGKVVSMTMKASGSAEGINLEIPGSETG